MIPDTRYWIPDNEKDALAESQRYPESRIKKYW